VKVKIEKATDNKKTDDERKVDSEKKVGNKTSYSNRDISPSTKIYAAIHHDTSMPNSPASSLSSGDCSPKLDSERWNPRLCATRMA
jgi:hypothetical protein